MIEPTSFADLATPQIDQQSWQEQLPAHLRLAAQLATDAHEHLQAYRQYLQTAGTRDDILDALEHANDAMATAAENITDAATQATEWATELHLPHFAPAS